MHVLPSEGAGTYAIVTKVDTDAVWIPEVDTDLDAETAELCKRTDFNDCVHVVLEAIVKE